MRPALDPFKAPMPSRTFLKARRKGRCRVVSDEALVLRLEARLVTMSPAQNQIL